MVLGFLIMFEAHLGVGGESPFQPRSRLGAETLDRPVGVDRFGSVHVEQPDAVRVTAIPDVDGVAVYNLRDRRGGRRVISGRVDETAADDHGSDDHHRRNLVRTRNGEGVPSRRPFVCDLAQGPASVRDDVVLIRSSRRPDTRTGEPAASDPAQPGESSVAGGLWCGVGRRPGVRAARRGEREPAGHEHRLVVTEFCVTLSLQGTAKLRRNS